MKWIPYSKIGLSPFPKDQSVAPPMGKCSKYCLTHIETAAASHLKTQFRTVIKCETLVSFKP